MCRGLASEVRFETRMDAMRATHEPALSIVESAEAARSQSEAAYLRIRYRIVSLDMPPGSVVQDLLVVEDGESIAFNSYDYAWVQGSPDFAHFQASDDPTSA